MSDQPSRGQTAIFTQIATKSASVILDNDKKGKETALERLAEISKLLVPELMMKIAIRSARSPIFKLRNDNEAFLQRWFGIGRRNKAAATKAKPTISRAA
jgi:hypothetical protein